MGKSEGKILRCGLFGFKKTDVLNYIAKIDERAEEKLKEKSEELEKKNIEIGVMKQELEEARKNRDAIVSVLEVAQKNAKEIIENARCAADEIEKQARTFAENEKNNLNREIEIKKREINNQFLLESKKITNLKREIEELRKLSIKAIKKFEQDLYNVERVLEQKESFTNSEKKEQEKVSEDNFFDTVRTVPIRVVKAENN